MLTSLKQLVHKLVAETYWVSTFHYPCSDSQLQQKIHELELERAVLTACVSRLEKRIAEITEVRGDTVIPNPKKRTGKYDEKVAFDVNVKTRNAGLFDAYDAFWLGNLDEAKFLSVLKNCGYPEGKAKEIVKAMG